MFEHAEAVNKKFAQMLDKATTEMRDSVNPTKSRPPYMSAEKYFLVLKTWNAIHEKASNQRRSQKVRAAGNALMDAGDALTSVGRKEEAETMFAWGESILSSHLSLC